MGRMVVVVAMLVVVIGAYAQVPKLINYQGKLTNASGVALATGDYDITFRIYNVETAGSALWTEAHTGGDAITVTNGLFDVQLGELTELDMAFDETYWIELQVGAEVLLPRERLVAVPYAFRSLYADTATVVGTGAVQSDGVSITGDGTAANPLAAVLGNSIESGEITDVVRVERH